MMQEKMNQLSAKFKELEKSNFKSLHLELDERAAHCVDEHGGNLYNCGWVVTNKARVWSLHRDKWLVPHVHNGYWRIGNVYVHLLVNHYFITADEQRLLQEIETHNVTCKDGRKWRFQVHHICPSVPVDESGMSREEKIAACMNVNNKRNLCVQKESDHRDAHKLLQGKKTSGREKGTEMYDSSTIFVMNNKLSGVRVTYSRENERGYYMTMKLPTFTSEDEERYKDVSTKFLVW